MRLKLKRKLNSIKGFSLTEVLAAVLILSMVSAVVAGGIPVAKDAYEKVTLSANAQVMLSTAVTALRNELSTADEIEAVDSKTIKYYSAGIQNKSTIGLKDKAGAEGEGIWLTLYSELEPKYQKWKKLVSDSVGAEKPGENRLRLTYERISGVHNGVIEVVGLRVVDSKQDNKVLAHLKGEAISSVLKIRVISGN